MRSPKRKVVWLSMAEPATRIVVSNNSTIFNEVWIETSDTKDAMGDPAWKHLRHIPSELRDGPRDPIDIIILKFVSILQEQERQLELNERHAETNFDEELTV